METTQTKTKCVLYARKSTEEDDQQIMSIEAQLFELREYASRERIEIVKIFTEGVLGVLPEWLGSLLIVSLIAAFMGTIDSSAFVLGVLVARMKKTAEESIIKSTRLFTLLGIIISAIASLYLFSFLSSVFALISLISVIGAALLASFLFKPNAFEINTFLIVGSAVFVLGLVLKFVTDNPITSLIPSGSALLALLFVRSYQRLITKSALVSK